jgi:hypothetical protein
MVGNDDELASEGGTNEQELQAACREYSCPYHKALRNNGSLVEGAGVYNLLS